MMSSSLLRGSFVWMVLGLIASFGAGCAGRTSVMPNSDPALRKYSTQFAADAARRHPYKADAPRGGLAEARAQVGYVTDHLQIINLSKDEWKDVEVWVNGSYVVCVPTMPPLVLKKLDFQMMYDADGNYFPTENEKTKVQKVEILLDGKMYDVTCHVAD